ncbi:SET-binding protein isoform X2 [Eucyclogobius newberryi]|uniref:SET-binding protein isoform X2 n=1 Tax=Eucyclogobius newberryi TaxID=166745 RepID=UPI003B5CE466
MEPRDPVGSARPKQAELQGGRQGPNEENQEGVGAVSLLRRDDAINGTISEGEGLEEQVEGLEEQEFSIKEASFKEGSLKLKIQTTKRTKKPPKNLENYICPPEIRMTIRPPVGEGRSGRQGRTSGAGARASKDEEKGPPRKRTYERQFRMPEQKEGGLLQLLGDPTPPKHQSRTGPLPAHSQQTQQFNRHGHQLTQDWLTASVPSTSLDNPNHPESIRNTFLDQTQSFSRSAHSPSPQRALTPDLQLPVVTDASILNLTSLSRGKGLLEVSEQLFGNIKKKYGRKESQKMQTNPQSGEISWEKQSGKDSPAHSEERSKYRQEETCEQYPEEREEGNRMAEESKGRKRRWKPSFDESFPTESHQRQAGESAEKHQNGPPEPKVAHKNDPQKNDTHFTSHRDGSGDRTEKDRSDKNDKREKGERLERRDSHDPDLNRIKKNPVGRPKTSTDSFKHREPTHIIMSKPSPSTTPRLPSPHPISSPRAGMSPIPSPKPRSNSSPSPSHSISSTGSFKPAKGKDRWSYLKAMKHTSLMSPQRDNKSSPSPFADPPSPFPITPSSPLYTNTDSLTVHTPIKRKRGRPKKQPLLTVETIHEGTSTSPPSPLSQDSSAALNCKRKAHTLNTLVHVASSKRGRGHRPVSRVKLGKMQSILNEILIGSSQGGSLSLKSTSAPVTTAMTAVASTIEARLGKQINVSKRGTIYIGKKRGRKPRAETQESKITKERSLFSGLHDSVVPSTTSSPSLRADASMPSLQPISAMPSKPLGRGFLSAGWKLSPPRLLANSPSHLSEGASVKEVTLSPISESHSEETIPSDSGIGTDNNSTSDQAEKGPASRRRYSFDLCGYETPEAAALEASSRDRRTQVTSVDNFLTQQEKKQKHHRRKRKCLQTRDHLHFLAELEEVVLKLQQLRVSHRRYTCYPQHPYPSIFRLNFHHFYPMTYDSYPCEPSPYMRRSVDLKAKRRRGRPAKASEPITSKLPFVQGYGYPLAGGNYYAAPYAMPYAAPLGLGYFPPAPPFYLPHPSLGPAPSSPFMRPAAPPPKAYHSAAHSNLQPGAKLHGANGSMQGASVRAESLGNSSAGGLRLHKRKHKHKHKHKDEPLLSPRDHQDLGGLFSGAKANARLSMMTDRRDFSQGSSKTLEKQRNSGRAPSLGMFGDDPNQQPHSHSLSDNQFHLRQTGQPIKSFFNSYSSDSQQPEPAYDLFLGSQEECNGRGKTSRLPMFGDQGLMSFHTAGQQPGPSKCTSTSLTGAAGKRRYKRREVEQIQNNVRRMHSLNFEHVQKILRAKRLQRQAKTGNNVIKRRPGRPRKQPVESVVASGLEQGLDLLSDRRADGRTLGMPVLERCDDLPGRQSVRPSLTPEALEFSNHDSIAATIETVVHQATSVPPAKGGKRRGRPHSRDNLWAPSSQ